MHGTSRGSRIVAALAALAVAGCAPVSGAASLTPEPQGTSANESQMLTMLDAVASNAEARNDGAPRVWLRAHAPFAGSNRVDVSYGVTEDAFVLVGMVGRDGELHILHPTQASGAHLVSASRSQRLNGVFTGFNVAPYSSGLHMTGSSLTDYGRNTGYVFAIASDREMNLQVLDELGWWATADLARDFQTMSPRLFAHRVASLIVRDDAQYSIDAVSVRSSSHELAPLAYTSSLCATTPYQGMHPLQAQSLIRFQLASGCSVPLWAIRRYVWPVENTPQGVRPRRPPPPPEVEDSSALLRDGRLLNEQVRTHLDRRRQASADSAAAAEASLQLRARELRRQILEVERERAESFRSMGAPVRPAPRSPAAGAPAGGSTGATAAPPRRAGPRPARQAEPAAAPQPAPPRRGEPEGHREVRRAAPREVRREPPPQARPSTEEPAPRRRPVPDQR